MARLSAPDAVPAFARPLADQIERRAEDLAAELRVATTPKQLRLTEARVFGDFESFLGMALERYQPVQAHSRGVGRLVFQPVYVEALDAAAASAAKAPESDHKARPALLAALMAAQVEALGPLRLTRNQTNRLAVMLRRLGEALDRDGLLIHAAAAYDRASRLYLDVDDHAARDWCLRQLASARHRAMPRGWRRTVQNLNRALFGYGFQPYRMLCWVGVQIAVAAVILVLLPKDKVKNPDLSIGGTLYVSVQDFVNPMGLGDTHGMSSWAWVVLTAESYLGVINISVFFALLVRKWFRM